MPQLTTSPLKNHTACYLDLLQLRVYFRQRCTFLCIFSTNILSLSSQNKKKYHQIFKGNSRKPQGCRTFENNKN